jgi:hypothetical protein
MRTFPTALAADLARRDGAAPVWLLRFTAAGTDYILCQDAVTVGPWGKTALPWIASWGQLTEGVSSTLADFNISSLGVDLINDPSTVPNLRTMAKSRSLNGVTVSVYLWVDGCTDAPFEMNSFMVTEIDLPNEASVNITLQDQSSKYENFYPGTMITKEAYPEADPDDVGKTIPMPFGTVSKLTALALDSGRMTSIPNAISATTTEILVSDITGLVAGMLLQIDEEIVSISTISGSALTVTRGVSATLAATHQRSAAVLEVKEEFVYIVADYALTNMQKAYARIGQVTMDISPICTVWPDGSHPAYPGKAVISVPGFITVQQAIDLVADDQITVNNGTLDTAIAGAVTKTGGAYLTGNITPGSAQALIGNINAGNILSVAGLINQTGSIVLNGSLADNGHSHSVALDTNQSASSISPTVRSSVGDFTISFTNPGVTRSSVSYSIKMAIVNVWTGYNTLTILVGGVTYVTDSVTWSNNLYAGKSYTYNFQVNSSQLSADSVIVHINWGNGSSNVMTVNSATRAISTNATGTQYSGVNALGLGIDSTALQIIPAALATTTNSGATNGTLDVTAGSLPANGTLTAADDIILNQSTLDAIMTGLVAKTGTVTLSGNSVANTLIGDAILVDVVSPITAPQDVITKILGTPCSLVGTFPAGYSFNGAITSSRRAPEWCHELARQCRSYFKWLLGQPTLIVRPDVLAPVKSINEIRLSNGMMIHGQRQTDINDVINTINLRYDRDWSSTSSGDEVYRQVSAGTDAASITTYGVRERPELFRFDFVTSQTMAVNLSTFYLSWYAYQRWQHTQECYLFEASLEFGDSVTLAFLDGEIGECTEVGFSPGNGLNIDKIQLTIIE